MNERLQELKEDIAVEQKNIKETIERLLSIKNKFQGLQKDYTTEPAIGTYLMNFYNGVEHILKRICKVYYGSFPTGFNWHKELLDLSYMPPQGKTPVFSKEIVTLLYRYKDFRHRFISGYGFQLKADKMMHLVDDVEPLWAKIQQELMQFLTQLSTN